MIALYIVGGIVFLILLLIAVAPLDFNMERQVSINKPKDVVFDYLKYLKNQDNWSVWNMKDPNMKQELKGTDGTVGALNSLVSENKNVGRGAQEIMKITGSERIDMELRFQEPMEVVHQAYFILKSNSQNQTQVSWGFKGKLKRPMNVIFPLMKGMLKKDFDGGLNNLKNILEK